MVISTDKEPETSSLTDEMQSVVPLPEKKGSFLTELDRRALAVLAKRSQLTP